MNRPSEQRAATLGYVVLEAFVRAAETIAADQIALYVVDLNDPHGFALAMAIHAKIPGPHPALLRERSQRQRARAPFMIEGAPFGTLVRATEGLHVPPLNDYWRVLGRLMPVIQHRGVPVLFVIKGLGVLNTLDAFIDPEGKNQVNGSSRPVPGNA